MNSNAKDMIACVATAIVLVMAFMAICLGVSSVQKKAPEWKESAMDAAAKASVSFEERKSKFKTDSVHE